LRVLVQIAVGMAAGYLLYYGMLLIAWMLLSLLYSQAGVDSFPLPV
jgi:hypothetical protein